MERAKQEQQLARRVSTSSIVMNALLSVFKLAAGLWGHSSALISDAVHSASDILSTVIVLVGLRLSAKAPDRGHEYGHERLECVAAVILALILAATGAGIGWNALCSIVSGAYRSLPLPGLLALAAAAVSILVKEVMYQYTKRTAKKLRSSSLMADAWHHRSDALSSVGSLLGVLGARLGFPVCDPIAGLVICLFILKAAVDVFRGAVSQLTDTSDPELEREMRRVALSVDGVVRVDAIRTRRFGNRVYVDLEIASDGGLSLYDAHRIADAVHDELEGQFPDVKHCMVHMNPI